MKHENYIKIYGGGVTESQKKNAKNYDGIEIFTGSPVKRFGNVNLALISDGNLYKITPNAYITPTDSLMGGYILRQMYEGYKLNGDPRSDSLLYTNNVNKMLKSPITRQPLIKDDLIKLGFDLEKLRTQILKQEQNDSQAVPEVPSILERGYEYILINYRNPHLIYQNIDIINDLIKRYTEEPNKFIRRYVANLIQIKINLNIYLDNHLEMYNELEIFDKYTDLFTSVMSESNSDLLMFSIHDTNVNSLFEIFFNNTSFQIEEITPNYLIDLGMKKGGNSLSKSVLNLNKSSNFNGGGVCDGDMVEPTNINYTDGFLVSGIVKTYDELLHDFKPYFSPGMLEMLGNIYNDNINKFVEMLKQKQNSNELDKIKKFIELVRSYTSIPETEWNYYTSVLRYIDSYCNKLDELNIVKISNISSYNLSPQTLQLLKQEGYIFKIPESASDSSSPPSSDSSSDAAASGQEKAYFYTTIDNQPVTKVFDIKDVLYRFSDNSTSNRKLMPLLFNSEQDGDNVRGFNDNNRRLISSDMIDLSYAPGLLDPKTLGDYTKSRDFYSPNNSPNYPSSITSRIMGMATVFDKAKLVRLQRLQNINEPLAFTARKFLTDGINSFCGYFGCATKIPDESPDASQANRQLETNYINNNAEPIPVPVPVPVPKVRFTTNGVDTYSGVEFDFPNPARIIRLIHGDTTIKNISDFVKVFNGVIPMEPPQDNDSWIRLHTFAKAIYDGIPDIIRNELTQNNTKSDELLTEIIISLKSFGDSLQVYYTKRMYHYFKNLQFDQLFITTTDKNVAAESLFIDSKFWIIGTGIRPHSDFYSKKIGFFGEQSYKNVLNNLPIVPDETRMDGSKAIMTNKSLMDAGKYVNSIRDTFLKICDYELLLRKSNIPDIKEQSSALEDIVENPTIEQQLEFLNVLYNLQILSDNGKEELRQKRFNVLNTGQPELLKKLSELDSFLKKIHEIFKLFDPPDKAIAAEMKSSKLLNKLDVMSDMIFKKCLSVFSCLKKLDLSLYIDKITAIKEKIHNAINFKNIIDDSLIEFARVNLNDKIFENLNLIKSQYAGLMIKTKQEFEEYMDIFNNVKTNEQRDSSSRSTASSLAQQQHIKTELDKNNDLKKIREKIETQQAKYNSLMENYGQSAKKTTLTKILEFTKLKKTDEARLKKYMINIQEYQGQEQQLLAAITKQAEISFQKNKEKKNGSIVREMAKRVLSDIRDQLDRVTSSITTKIGISASSKGGKIMNKTIRHYSKKKYKKSINHRNKKRRNTKKYKKTKKPKKTYKTLIFK